MPISLDRVAPNRSRDSHHGPFFSSVFQGETRIRAQIFALVGSAALLLFWFLLPPSIARGGDSGELISASHTLGIAHPSGYPVWCLLARLFAALPVGEIAWRYNLFSAICGALAAATMAVTAHRLLCAKELNTERKSAHLAATGAGLLLAGFFFFGSQAIIAEVYALAALEGAILIYFALKWKQDNDWRDFYTFSFLAGLSPLVHLSGIFLWPILSVWMLWKAKLTARQVSVLIALFLTGLVPLLYFPIRSAAFPLPPLASLDNYFYFPLDWGHPASFSALKAHLSAAQYSRLLQPKNALELWGNGLHLLGFLFIQYLWATPLLLWGAISAFKHRIGAVLLLIFAFNVGVEIQYDVGDQQNFFFPAYLVMALWMALGWFEFFGWLQRIGEKLARGQQSLWPWRLQTLGALILMATIAAQWFLFAAGASQRNTVRPRDGALEAASAAQTLAQREGKTVAALYVHDDTLWPFWYAKYALGAAPDVETPWGRGLKSVQESDRMADYVAQLKKSGPVVLAQWDEATDARFPLVMLTPSGNLCEATNRALPPAATPLATKIENPTPGPNGLLAARFRRAKLWQSRDALPAFSPASLAAFEVDFRVSKTESPLGIEVLLVKNGALIQKPEPNQQMLSEGKGETARILISRQKRRLILPASASQNQILRAAVPIQIEASSPLGAYTVWTRLVASTAEKTSWTRTDAVELTSK